MVNQLTDQEQDEQINLLRQALTVRQLKFADGVLDGLPHAEAYRIAYPSCTTDNAAYVAASRAIRKVKVNAYVSAVRASRALRQAKLRAEEDKQKVLSRQRKREILASIAEDAKAPHPSRIQAVNVDNAMTGDNEPVRVEFTLSGIVRALSASRDLPSVEIGGQAIEQSDSGPESNGHAKDLAETAKVCYGQNGGHS